VWRGGRTKPNDVYDRVYEHRSWWDVVPPASGHRTDRGTKEMNRMVKEVMHIFRQRERLAKYEYYEFTEEGGFSIRWTGDPPETLDAAPMGVWGSEWRISRTVCGLGREHVEVPLDSVAACLKVAAMMRGESTR